MPNQVVQDPISELAQLFGGIYGGIQQSKQTNWNNAGIINVLNYLKQQSGTAANDTHSITDFLRPLMGTQANTANTERYGSNIFNNGVDQNNLGSMQLQGRTYDNSGWNDQLAQLAGLGTGAQGTSDYLQQLLQSGGVAQNSSYGQDRSKDILGGQTQTQQSLQDLASRLLSSGGANQLDGFQDRANDTLNAGGMNSVLDGLNGIGFDMAGNPRTAGINGLGAAGQNTLDTNGQTQTGAAAEAAGLQGILGGGNNATTNYMTGRGQQITGKDPLLPFDTAISLARNEAATGNARAAENMRRQAMARGGGPGATVANGLQNQALADFQDKALQNESSAVTDAMKNQQALQLNQFGQGAGLMQTGQALANQRLGTYGDITSQLENNATKRFGIGGDLLGQSEGLANNRQNIGLNAIQGGQGLANQRVGTYGNLGLGSGQLDLSRMAAGGQFANDYNNASLGGANALSGFLQNDTSRLGQGIQGYNNLLSTQGGIANNVLGNNMAQNNSYYNNLNHLGEQNLGWGGLAQQGVNGSNSGLSGLLSQWLNYQGNMDNSVGGLFRMQPATNPYAALSGMQGGGFKVFNGSGGSGGGTSGADIGT